jgi:two-component system, sensor histidine kinase
LYTNKVENSEYAVMSVSDTGIGIPIEMQKLIFEEFRQVKEGVNRPFEGIGLGLTLTKKYVALLKGFIFPTSMPGKGSTFYVYFPLKSDDQSDGKIISNNNRYTIESRDNSISGLPKILLIENDDIAISLTKIYLKDFYALDISQNVQSAILLTEKNNYDLILMDINLEDKVDGIYLTKMLRDNPKYKETPIIAFTAYAMESDKKRFINAGCSDYLSKPFNRAELTNKIKENLNKSSSQ